jgi:hypothetical protein
VLFKAGQMDECDLHRSRRLGTESAMGRNDDGIAATSCAGAGGGVHLQLAKSHVPPTLVLRVVI